MTIGAGEWEDEIEREKEEDEVDERPEERVFSLVPMATRPCANIY